MPDEMLYDVNITNTELPVSVEQMNELLAHLAEISAFCGSIETVCFYAVTVFLPLVLLLMFFWWFFKQWFYRY